LWQLKASKEIYSCPTNASSGQLIAAADLDRQLQIRTSMTSNLHSSEDSLDFWVWINPQNWLVKHQITFTGGFTSGGLLKKRKSNLMFIPNPEFESDITPFQFGIMREYMAEYNLEIGRERNFTAYPSRLNAIYLFASEPEAHKYKKRNMSHVSGRILKKVHSVTPCVYSVHDSSWVDFLRLTHSVDSESLDNISNAYWSGKRVQDSKLLSMGEPWSQEAVLEVLFLGRIEFYDRDLTR
jgi:hypothetical protein